MANIIWKSTGNSDPG